MAPFLWCLAGIRVDWVRHFISAGAATYSSSPFHGFAKIAQADLFVFLDDVQFSKNSFTNRVQVLNGDRRHWLTVPVRVKLGDAINKVLPAKPGWARSHRDTLANFYRRSPAYRSVWPDIEGLYDGMPDGDVAAINAYVIETIAGLLGFSLKTACSSSLETGSAVGDARLSEIVSSVAPGGVYLSGSGGENYQSNSTFETKNITLRYTRFAHPVYDQGGGGFESGLSVLDAVFRMGWSGTHELIMASIR